MMQKQNTTQKIIPQVRYHPSIKINTPEEPAAAKPRTKTRCAAGPRPQTRTDHKTVQENQETPQVNPGPAVRPSPAVRPGRAARPDPAVRPSPAVRPGPVVRPGPAARPDPAVRQSPAGKPGPVARPGPAARPDPAVRPGPDGEQRQRPVQRADPDPGRVPITPEQVPLGLGVQLAGSVVDQVEVLTRGQRINPDWFIWRKNRITASVAHRIAHCRFVNGKSKAPPTSYLAAVTGEGPRVQTRAMSWGVEMEAKVVQKYQKLKSAKLGRSVLVQDCGLFIDPQNPWLAASPDGIVTDSRTGQWLLCLEVKCPYKHRDRRVEDACREDPAFCLEIQDEDGRQPGGSPAYRLKTSHSYFTQIQVQLAVTGLRRADLVVYTNKETAIVPVSFDPDLWEETVSKLQVFYRDAVLPHLREKTQQDTAAAWTPEL